MATMPCGKGAAVGGKTSSRTDLSAIAGADWPIPAAGPERSASAAAIAISLFMRLPFPDATGSMREQLGDAVLALGAEAGLLGAPRHPFRVAAQGGADAGSNALALPERGHVVVMLDEQRVPRRARAVAVHVDLVPVERAGLDPAVELRLDITLHIVTIFRLVAILVGDHIEHLAVAQVVGIARPGEVGRIGRHRIGQRLPRRVEPAGHRALHRVPPRHRAEGRETQDDEAVPHRRLAVPAVEAAEVADLVPRLHRAQARGEVVGA